MNKITLKKIMNMLKLGAAVVLLLFISGMSKGLVEKTQLKSVFNYSILYALSRNLESGWIIVVNLLIYEVSVYLKTHLKCKACCPRR